MVPHQRADDRSFEEAEAPPRVVHVARVPPARIAQDDGLGVINEPTIPTMDTLPSAPMQEQSANRPSRAHTRQMPKAESIRGAPRDTWSDPFSVTGVPPLPKRDTCPSDGVAYRLALAREQARARSSQSSKHMPGLASQEALQGSSRALLRPSVAVGGARRVVVPKPDFNRPNVLVTSKEREHRADVSSASKTQFTPHRRVLSPVNDDRLSSSEAT